MSTPDRPGTRVRARTPDRPHPPSVERLLAIVRGEIEASEPAAITAIVRRVVDDERARLTAGADPLSEHELADAVVARLDDLGDPGLTIPPIVINATGVILHTIRTGAMAEGGAAGGDRGRLGLRLPGAGRGHREARAPGRSQPRSTWSRSRAPRPALVVTNNAAALMLAVGLAGATRIHRGLARRARGDRGWSPDPRDRGPGRREAGGSGDHESDPPCRLRGGAGRGQGVGGASRPPVQLRHERLHGVGGPHRSGGDRPPARCTGPR